MFKRFVVLSCVTILILASCTTTAVTPLAPNTPTVVPTSAPTATAVPQVATPTAATTAPIPASDPDTFSLPASCYRKGLPIYINRAAKFCFAYPQHFSLGEMNPGQPAILGPALDTNPDPLRATFTFQVKPAAGKSLADHLAAYALETGTSPETQLAEVALDGEAGKVIEPVMGRPNAKSVLVLHGNNLYTLSFAPKFKDASAAQQTVAWKKAEQDMQALYEIVTSSFAFLDQPRAAGANDILGITPSCLLEGNSLYLDSDQGYCLAVPPRYTVDVMNPGQRAIFGPALDASPDPLRISLLVDVKPVPAGNDTWKVADEFVKANPNSAITRSATEIGRQAAVMLGNVPGRSSSLNVLTVNNDKLYNLYFRPDGNPRAKPDLDALNAVVMGSFGFLPSAAPTSAAPNPVAPALDSRPPDSCVVAGQQTYVNAFDGFCFAYPSRFELKTAPTGQPELYGPALDPNLDPVRASMGLEVEVAVKDARLGEIVDQYLKQFESMDVPAIARSPIELGGEPAEMLEVVPGREGSRDVFMLHEGTLYHFMFMPSVRDFAQAKTDVEALYNTVTQSFTFTSKKPRPIEVSASPRDPGVSGVARWGTQPVPNAIVELRTGDWRVNSNAVLQRAMTDPEGRYFMANTPAGDYVMCGLFPEGVQERSTCTPVHIEAGQDVAGIDVMLLRTVNAVAPSTDTQVVALPTLSWQSFPNAAKYEVFVIDAGTTELLHHEFVADTHFTVRAALQPGRTYTWVVNAIAADGGLLADVDSRFVVQP